MSTKCCCATATIFAPGAVAPRHVHEEEQIVVVIEGEFTFDLDGDVRVMRKGDVAVDMKLSMHDDSNPTTLKDRTDGELFYIIKNGKDQMPLEGNRVKDETIWDMVNYLRSLSKKGEADKPVEEKAPETKSEDKPDQKPSGDKPQR